MDVRRSLVEESETGLSDVHWAIVGCPSVSPVSLGVTRHRVCDTDTTARARVRVRYYPFPTGFSSPFFRHSIRDPRVKSSTQDPPSVRRGVPYEERTGFDGTERCDS